jgi:hypothetical protein
MQAVKARERASSPTRLLWAHHFGDRAEGTIEPPSDRDPPCECDGSDCAVPVPTIQLQIKAIPGTWSRYPKGALAERDSRQDWICSAAKGTLQSAASRRERLDRRFPKR